MVMELRPRKGRPGQAPSTPSEVVKPSPRPRPPSSRKKTVLTASSVEIQDKTPAETPLPNQQLEIPQETQVINTKKRISQRSSRKTADTSCVKTLPAESVTGSTPLAAEANNECRRAASRTANKSKVVKSSKRNTKERYESSRILFPDSNEDIEAIESVCEVHATSVGDVYHRREAGTVKNSQSDKKPDIKKDESSDEAATHVNTGTEQPISCANILHMAIKGTTDIDGKSSEQEQQDDQNADSILISNRNSNEKSLREYKNDKADKDNTHGSSANKKIGKMSDKKKTSAERFHDTGGSAKRSSQVSSLSTEINVIKMQNVGDGDVVEEGCSNSEDSNDDTDADDEELAKLFVKSLKSYMQQSDCSVPKEAEKKQDILEDENRFSGIMEISCSQVANGNASRLNSLDPVWSPKVDLLSSKNIQSRNSKSSSKVMPESIWKKEAKLQDGLVVPPIDPLKLNKLARKQKDNTAGAKWFNLPAPTITPELKKELQLLKLRGVVDPKRHYKVDDSKGLPRYFEVGTVVEGPTDFYSGRLTNKERKGSLADELLSDYSLSSYRKRKYLEIQDQKQAGGKSFWKAKTKKRTPTWARM